jgi:nucleoside-triphosphatase THEP1
MECLSPAFRSAVLEALNSPDPVLATIAMKGDAFVESLKAREDVSVFVMNQSNRDTLFASILSSVRESIS